MVKQRPLLAAISIIPLTILILGAPPLGVAVLVTLASCWVAAAVRDRRYRRQIIATHMPWMLEKPPLKRSHNRLRPRRSWRDWL